MLSEEAGRRRPTPPRWAVHTQKPPPSASVPSFLESVSQTDCKNKSEATHHYPGLTALPVSMGSNIVPSELPDSPLSRGFYDPLLNVWKVDYSGPLPTRMRPHRSAAFTALFSYP